MQTQDIRQLASWLAETDIDFLELRGPDVQLQIHRDGAVTNPAPAAEPAPAPAPAPDLVAVRAPSVGVLLDRIPGRTAALCPPGTAVQSGSLLALLQVGTLLLPVHAPCDGWAGEWRLRPGSPVDYGTPLLDIFVEPVEEAT